MRVSTPVGELTERVEFDPGFESRWVREHMIKSVEDYAIVKYICDHTELEPTPQEYLEADSTMGEQGIIVGGLPPIPLLWLQAEVMGTETWCMGMMQHPDEFDELHESVMRLYRRRLEIAADSPAEVIWFADSLSGTLVSPRLFDRYCRDTYEYGCTLFHQAGKRAFAHFDGANAPIKDCIANSSIDIVEAFTPPPMGHMTVAEARAAWPDKVVSVNFPGNLFICPDAEIEAYTKKYMEDGGQEGKFVIGCTEEFPREEFDRVFSAIARAMNEYENCSV
jgi:uroporphyrinogen-III decarboxylase